MTKLNAIETNYEEIKKEWKECTEAMLLSRGKTFFKIFAGKDGVSVVETNDPESEEKYRMGSGFFITNVGLFDLISVMTMEGYEDAQDDDEAYRDLVISYVDSIDFDERMEEITENLFYEV